MPEKIRIEVPSTLIIKGALELDRRLRDQPRAEEYIIDFAKLGRTEPFGMLYSALSLADFARARSSAIISAVNYDHCSYQAHMGFFHALGFQLGKRLGEATGSLDYLPITALSAQKLTDQAAAQGVHVGDVITAEAERMSAVLARTSVGDLYETLSYAIREIVRNVVEHSGSDHVLFCAQHWPTRNCVQLAIFDKGVGIKASLQSNPYLTIDTDLDALKLAVMPGVSGKMYKGVPRRAYDEWQNSGYGLYMTCRLAARGGNFCLFSGSSGFAVLRSGDHRDVECDLRGTGVRIVLNTSRIADLKESLKRFATDGKDIAKIFGGNTPSGASTASRTIRTKFK